MSYIRTKGKINICLDRVIDQTNSLKPTSLKGLPFDNSKVVKPKETGCIIDNTSVCSLHNSRRVPPASNMNTSLMQHSENAIQAIK